MPKLLRRRRLVTILTCLVAVTAGVIVATPTSSGVARRGGGLTAPVTPTSSKFSYGFDFAQQGPYPGADFNPQAVASARRVLASIPGMLEDTAIMDWGLPDPEPAPGEFRLAGIAARIRLILSARGTPVITLCAAPPWMTGGEGAIAPPTPAYYAAFATLAATIARSFPRVRYFVVWNELKGFWDPAVHGWDIAHYTDMYNLVYKAIKAVRPGALVGGPYVVTQPYPAAQLRAVASTPHGRWGFVSQAALDAIDYWLGHAVGADFVAVDGPDFPQSGPITDPLTATNMYAAVDRWITVRTKLRVWWMESHVQPADSPWSARQAAAIRVATLVRAASTGARVGLQWQPQVGEGIADEGLWTSTRYPGGGRPTVLAKLLPSVLELLRDPISVVGGQRSGVLVARGGLGTIAINTTTARTAARLGNRQLTLEPGQVRVSLSTPSRGTSRGRSP